MSAWRQQSCDLDACTLYDPGSAAAALPLELMMGAVPGLASLLPGPTVSFWIMIHNVYT